MKSDFVFLYHVFSCSLILVFIHILLLFHLSLGICVTHTPNWFMLTATDTPLLWKRVKASLPLESCMGAVLKDKVGKDRFRQAVSIKME